MKIYFARHGESQANLLHVISNRGLRHGLTYRGREQAVTLADQLQGHPIARIYSSPVLRAIETSVIVANQLNLDYEVVDALREYDCGVLEGRSDEAAWQQWQELFDTWVIHKRWDERHEGGESFHDIHERFVPFIEGLVQCYAGTQEEIICVAHGGIYTMMLPLVMKNVDQMLISRYGFDYSSCVVAELKPEGLMCVEWNGHLVEVASNTL
jgi:broad specificity phosphatase PhoE